MAHKSTSSHAMTTEQLTYKCNAPMESLHGCHVNCARLAPRQRYIQTCITSRQEHNNLADSTPVLGQSRLKVPDATTFTFYTIE